MRSGNTIRKHLTTSTFFETVRLESYSQRPESEKAVKALSPHLPSEVLVGSRGPLKLADGPFSSDKDDGRKESTHASQRKFMQVLKRAKSCSVSLQARM